MNKKGFTLIELLAVILILGIIALIAIPAVNNVIEDSKKNASKTSALSYIKAINDQNSLHKLQPNKFTAIQSGDVEDITVSLKGEGPDEGTVTIENGKVVSAVLCIGGYINNYNGTTVTTGGKCTNDGLKGLAKKVYFANTLATKAPTLTTTSTLANEAGFYSSTSTNSGKPTYYFRGNVNNNYVTFAGKTWRIVRINEDGTVRLILDESINTTAYAYTSSNSKCLLKWLYYSLSDRIKGNVDTWYNNNIGNNNDYDSKVATGSYFCEQARVSSIETNTGQAETLTFYPNYTPTFTCATDLNGYGPLDYKVGLLTYDELVSAGAYYNVEDTTNYLHKNYTWWTMSPAGYEASTCNGSIFQEKNNKLFTDVSHKTARIRPVINLKANVNATGKGTALEPYVVE